MYICYIESDLNINLKFEWKVFLTFPINLSIPIGTRRSTDVFFFTLLFAVFP